MKLKQSKNVEWTKLDNASKYFPATANELDTKVFRLSCELYEIIDPDILQKALNKTIESFPFFRSILRRGVFWYYFESSDLIPEVSEEFLPICAPIYNKNTKNLLFRVFYYHKRISFEIFHALSDGKGALLFFQTLIYYYLVYCYEEEFKNHKPALDYSASIKKKMDDSFNKHFIGDNRFTPNIIDYNKRIKAHRIRGKRTEENRMKLIEGSMSVKAVLSEAKKNNTSLTIYLAALFIYSIYKEMNAIEHRRPIILSVPINLRQFFESHTTRNFFSTMNVGYQFRKEQTELQDVIESITESFERDLTVDKINYKINRLISLEKNPFMRIIPLPIKDYSIRIANKWVDRGITGAISNIGKVPMPEEFESYIRQFTICTSARRPQICMCSYGDRLTISFTSPFKDTEIQRRFFEHLSNKGIQIEISSNM